MPKILDLDVFLNDQAPKNQIVIRSKGGIAGPAEIREARVKGMRASMLVVDGKVMEIMLDLGEYEWKEVGETNEPNSPGAVQRSKTSSS